MHIFEKVKRAIDENLTPIICIGENFHGQYDLIKSVYTYTCHEVKHVPKPYKRRYVNFNNWFDHCIYNENSRGGHKAWDRDNDYLRMIDFHHLINCLEVFFPNRINIVLFEDLKFESKLFYKKISKIMKIDFSKCPEGLFTHKTNISGNQSLVKLNALIKRLPFGKKFLRTEKIRNSQVYNFARNMIRKYGFKTVMKKEQKIYINNRYKNGNREIAKKYKLPLKKYGYPF